MKTLTVFKYSFLKGPVPASMLDSHITEGNCRLAIQEYFYKVHGRYFSEQELLNPEGYLYTGRFLRTEPTNNFFDDLPTGAMVYAERTRTKAGEPIDCSEGVSCLWPLDVFLTYYKPVAAKQFV